MLFLHRAQRSDALATALAEVLLSPLADPFATEIVAVPAKGVERWLCQRLSTVLGAVTTDGVAANIEFPTPSRLVAAAFSAAAGVDPDEDPWATSRLLWTVLDVVDGCLDEPWCAVLARHLGAGIQVDGGTGELRAGRRYATAAHFSELFAGYRANRPQLLLDWAAGNDTDGTGSALPPDLRWQAQLWRQVRERIGQPSPSERLAAVCGRLRAEPGLVELPERVSLFGPNRLSTEQLAVLDALAVRRDVHLWLPHPSPAMWQKLTSAPAVHRRSADRSALVVEHPLLASLARDVREFQLRLARYDSVDSVADDGAARDDTLLGRIQADLRDDRAPVRGATADGTVQVHACHGPARQVEVLRESLLHLFQQDPTLEPRDVLVMCPDVETFAPLVRAAFGQGLGHPGHRLRVRLADRSLRQTNPLLDTVAALLALADGRVTASQVLDLAAGLPVRRRFGFDDEDLERLRDWATASGARWALGQRQRSAFGLLDLRQNTWNTAVDRILLGVTADETEPAWLGDALPLDDVDGNDIDLAGRLTEFLDRLASVLGTLQGTQPARSWTGALNRALELLTDVGRGDEWQLAQARRELNAASEHSGECVLRLPDVRSMLALRLAGRPTRANFRTGELTVCTMVPMRSVPHRVVALLGLDDEIFPRGGGIDGDDVLPRDPCVGERDPRSEDRQLLLDAVLSAGEQLIVCYTGADPVTGARRPPAIPLSELLDVVATMVGRPALAQVETRHPLQPFDARNFRADAPFSFDRGLLSGARAQQGRKVPVPVFLPAPLPLRAGDVTLADLVGFLVHPTQAFLRQRLGVRVPQADDDILDALSVELDGLQKWDVGERMLAERLAGVSGADFRQLEWRRGTLPPLRIGATVLKTVEKGVDALVDAAAPVHAGPADIVDVEVDLGSGRRLTGTVTGVHGRCLAATSYSTLAPKHRLAAWARLLAVAAGTTAGPWQAVTTGRGPYGRPVSRSTLRAPGDALEQLRRLVDLRDRGLQAPPPIAVGASAVYGERRFRGSTPPEALEAAAKAWSDRFGDATDRHHGYLYGPSPRFDRITDAAPLDDERAWSAEPTRFGVLATRLWTPLLAAESLGAP